MSERDEIHRLRATLRAQILLTEAIAARLIDKGVLNPSEVTMPWSIAELQVLDPELRESWALARNRLAERKALGNRPPENTSPD